MLRKSILFAALVTAAFGITIPRPAGEVTIKVPGKPDVKLSSYRGKIVILAFIDINCSHCQHATQVLTGIQRDYFMRGVQVLEGSWNQATPSDLAGFTKMFKTNFPVGTVDPQFMMNYSEITPQMRPIAPIILFIDRKGVIQAQWFGNDPQMEPPEDQPKNFKAQVDKMIAVGQAAGKKR